jgi:hypothetical protein
LASRSFRCAWIDGRYMGPLPSVAMPIVALKRCALAFASADWVRMPLGKYRRRPNADSIESTSGADFSIAAFSSAARGLIAWTFDDWDMANTW